MNWEMFSFPGQPAASRGADMRPVRGGGGGEICPSTGGPAAAAGEGDRPRQLWRCESSHREEQKCDWRQWVQNKRLICNLLFQIEEEQEEKGADRLLFSYLTLLTKLSKHCGFLELSKPSDTLRNIWGKERTCITSPLLTNAFCTCSLKHVPALF